jgi:DNA segregation ATPase FtsK/SpoIIIE, S-DNA-T family
MSSNDMSSDQSADGDGRGPGTAVQRRSSGELATRPAADMTRSVTAPSGGRRVLHTTVRESAHQAGRAVTGPRARAMLRWLLRNSVLYMLTGGWVLARRGWEARTNARYERQMRAAEAAGEYDKLTDWEARAERVREQRHRRRMDWITAPIEFARTTAVLVGWLSGGLLGLGAVLAVAHSDLTWVLAPLNAAVRAVAWLVWLIDTVWRPVLVTLAVLGLAGVWEVGRRSGALPGWAAPAHARVDTGVVITPGGVAAALAHLGIPALTRAVKDGWQVEFSTPPVRVNRCGYQAVFSLPMGVTPEMIADKRDVLARNLVRAPLEVWPAAADHAGWVDLWVADPGSAERLAPPYPLLHDGRADVFDGVPVGVSQRGEVIALALPGANLVYGGLMGQGKSNAARVTMLGAALDPLAVLWVFVFANNGDFDAYQPRLARYHRGVDDVVAAAALDGLRELYADVARREARLAELGAKKVTRVLAERYPELRPTVALFSECHELFGHATYGAEAADLAVQTMRRGRKTAITLAFDTQSSRADAIPPRIVELVKINACFAVKAWRSNDGFLGDGSFQAGIRATELRPGKDVGTSIVTGATPERFEIVKWFYIEVDDDTGYDAAAEVIERSMVSLPNRSTDVAVIPPAESRDLLDDLDTVLGVERINVADVPALLRELAPSWAPYRKLTGVMLRKILAKDQGITIPRAHNTWPLDPADVRRRITERAATDTRADKPEGS